MKLALVIDRFRPDRGGAERVLTQLLTELQRRGHDLSLVAMSWTAPLPFPVQCHRVRVPRYPRWVRELLFARKSAALLRRLSPDLVLGVRHTAVADVLLSLDGLHAEVLKGNLRAGPSFLRRLLYRVLPKHRLFLRSDRQLFQRPRPPLVIAPSQLVKKQLIEAFAYDPSRIIVNYHGVNLERFHPASPETRDRVRGKWEVKDCFVALFVAHNYRLKGLPSLLKAWRRLDRDRFRLLVVGRGRPLPSAADLPNVRFLGARSDLPELYQAADVLVHPTFYDVFPLVVLEAMSSGLPVITTRYWEAESVVSEGKTGYLIDDPRDTETLVDRIHRLSEPEVRRDFSLAARRTAEGFPESGFIESTVQALEEEAARKKRVTTGSEPSGERDRVPDRVASPGVITKLGSNPLRIVQMNLQTGWGGGEQIALLLGTALRERGHQVSFCCAPGSVMERRAGEENFGVHTFRSRSQLDLSALLQVLRWLKRERPDVLHLHTAKEVLLGAAAGRLAGVPSIVYTRHLVMPVKPMMRWVYNRLCDRVVCVARAVQDNLVRSGVTPERTKVIYGAIDVDAFMAGHLPKPEAKSRIGCRPDETVIGIVGSLIPAKGQQVFLKAVSQLPRNGRPNRFVVVGRGEERTRLEELAKDLGIADQVLFLGFRRDMPQVISAFDILVLASISGEAFPLVILEAMASGTPVVATAISGVPEVVENEVTGMLVPLGDASRLSEAIGRLLDDPGLADRLAGEAAKRARQQYGVQRMVDETEELYGNLMARTEAGD